MIIRHLSKKGIFFFLIIDIALVAVAVSVFWRPKANVTSSGESLNLGHMRISSSAFLQDEYIPPAHTCDGRDLSPQLSWDDVPEETRSLVLVVDDPDAPSGAWTHWTMWNIPPTAKGVEQGGIVTGAVLGTTSAGSAGWHGPCPPFGVHRYFFKLFALDVRLELPASSSVSELEQAMVGHILDKAGLVGRYERLKQ